MTHITVYKSRSHNKLSLFAFLVLCLVGLAGLTLMRPKGFEVMTVESSSMAPNIRKGDAVVLKPVKTSELHVGDIVSYRSPVDQSVIVTHRIVEDEAVWGQIVTKGDNAPRNDRPIAMDQVIGKVDVRVVYLGFALDFLRTPAGLIAGVYLPALLIVGLEVRRLVGHYTKPTYRLLGYARR